MLMLVVMALGGNALLRRGQPLEAEVQRRNLLDAVAKAVAPIARRHQLVITHGNGPQIGLLALQAAAYKEVCPYPLDVLGAESEGMIGYLIEQALSNELPGREIATLLTQVEVDSSDPAFAKPSKPIGPIYGEVEARELSARTSWTFMPDAGGFRRAVPSPAPRRIREINVIKLLVQSGMIVICAGGGGIPVVATADGALRGIEAVIDKDVSSALLPRKSAPTPCCCSRMFRPSGPNGRCRPADRSGISRRGSCAPMPSNRVLWHRRWKPPVASPNARGALLVLELSIKPKPSLRVGQERLWP